MVSPMQWQFLPYGKHKQEILGPIISTEPKAAQIMYVTTQVLTATTAATTLTTASSEATAFTFAGHDGNVLVR